MAPLFDHPVLVSHTSRTLVAPRGRAVNQAPRRPRRRPPRTPRARDDRGRAAAVCLGPPREVAVDSASRNNEAGVAADGVADFDPRNPAFAQDPYPFY